MKKKLLVLFILIAVFLSACDPPFVQPTADPSPPETNTPTAQVYDPSKRSPTGFYWPTGEEPIILQKWLAHGCDNSGTYFDGSYHIGLDIDAEEVDPVYSISPGIVIHISPNDWGSTNGVANKGAIIQHYLEDGDPFIAVYGHIQTNLIKDDVVNAGQEIGTIGHWNDGVHLHFGIFPDGYIDGFHLGKMPCPSPFTGKESLNKNGAVDPLDWLNTRYPGEIPQGPLILAPGGSGSDEEILVSSSVISATVAPGEATDEKCTLVQENAIYAKLGHYFKTFFVIGDSRIWKTEDNSEWPEFDPKPPPVNLRHLGNIDCVIKIFREETLPVDYTVTESDEIIGSTQYHVEDYQYASTVHIKKYTISGTSTQIAVVTEDGNEQCFADARQVLLCSELIDFGPLGLLPTSDQVNPSEDLASFAVWNTDDLLLTYDKNSWNIKEYPNGLKALDLINSPDCSIHQNLGRGAPEWWQRTITQETIGSPMIFGLNNGQIRERTRSCLSPITSMIRTLALR